MSELSEQHYVVQCHRLQPGSGRLCSLGPHSLPGAGALSRGEGVSGNLTCSVWPYHCGPIIVCFEHSDLIQWVLLNGGCPSAHHSVRAFIECACVCGLCFDGKQRVAECSQQPPTHKIEITYRFWGCEAQGTLQKCKCNMTFKKLV